MATICLAGMCLVDTRALAHGTNDGRLSFPKSPANVAYDSLSWLRLPVELFCTTKIHFPISRNMLFTRSSNPKILRRSFTDLNILWTKLSVGGAQEI